VLDFSFHAQYNQPFITIITNVATIKNKQKKIKTSEINHCKISQTQQDSNSILRLIFSTHFTNDIIGYGQLTQKTTFSISYTHSSIGVDFSN